MRRIRFSSAPSPTAPRWARRAHGLPGCGTGHPDRFEAAVRAVRSLPDRRFRGDVGTERAVVRFVGVAAETGRRQRLRGSCGMTDETKTSEQRPECYRVRQVTNIQASWTEKEPGEAGQFTLQLILDNGVAEYILAPDEDDMDVLLQLFARSPHTTFDLDRKVLMFANISVK
jgi:hypothetical protein